MAEWAALLRRAVAMGLTPDAFWRLSWREWQMLNGRAATPVLDRAALDVLMEAFPDE